MFRKQAKRAIASFSINNYEVLNRIELSRASTLENFQLFQNLHKKYGIIPVIKSNAYGHGLTEMAQILNDANAKLLAVDGYFEAAKIRHMTKHRILVMGYIKPENVKLLDVSKCSFVVQDIDGLKAFARLGKHVKVHMEINTGMNRLGLQEREIDNFLNELRLNKNLELEGIMTHLADADNPQDDRFTEKQVKLFDRTVKKILAEGLRPEFIHMANTGGTAKVNSQTANSARIGIGIYGINPLDENDPRYKVLEGLKPVLTLKSTVIKTIDLEKGGRVSYNGTFTASKQMKIAVLPLGYYEGIPRDLSNKGRLTSSGSRLPTVGKVCMNHTMVDITGTTVGVGDEITVIDSDKDKPNSIRQIAKQNKLFDYELLTRLSSSLRREIV